MNDHTSPADFTAELVERTVVVTWPDNERGGATPPPDGWTERAWDQPTLHEIDEGSVSGCSALRWRNDLRPDAELVAVSLALVSGAELPASSAVRPPATDRTALLREVAAECDKAGGVYGQRGANEAAGAAFALMETFLRQANEAEYVATPCDFVACEPGGEPCSIHERLMAHAEGDHELCAPNCEPAAVVPDQTDETADTLPAWLYQRFMQGGEGWDHLDDDQRAYWGHQARAVRRAVDRGGFKPAAVSGRTADETEVAVQCGAVVFRQPHGPHRWAPQPGMDPVRCPGVCSCDHPDDEHSVYGCDEDCPCEYLPVRKKPPMDPVHILGIGAADAPAVGGAQQQEADRVVAYRLPASRDLHCLACCAPPRGDIWTPVTTEELEDGGVCTTCGGDVLIEQQPKETRP